MEAYGAGWSPFRMDRFFIWLSFKPSLVSASLLDSTNSGLVDRNLNSQAAASRTPRLGWLWLPAGDRVRAAESFFICAAAAPESAKYVPDGVVFKPSDGYNFLKRHVVHLLEVDDLESLGVTDLVVGECLF